MVSESNTITGTGMVSGSLLAHLFKGALLFKENSKLCHISYDITTAYNLMF